MNNLFTGLQKMDIKNLNLIEEKIVLLKDAFEKIKNERDRLLTEAKIKDEEINQLNNKINEIETDNDIVIKKIDDIIYNLENINLN
jgi:septal ring factor EnvC (AmiA/AmiB activator)